MDANEQRAVALLKEAAGGNAVIHPDMGYVNIEWALRAIMAALAQQVPADGEWVLVPRKAIHTLVNYGTLHESSTDDELHAYVEARDLLLNTIAATPQAPQPVVDTSQPQQGAVAWDVWDERGGLFAGRVAETYADELLREHGNEHYRKTPLYTTIGHGTLEGNHLQAVDDAMVERACIAYYELPAWQFMSHKAGCKDRMRAALTAALAAHGKGG